MLFSGSRGAPYTCLRCQLRQAIFPSRRRCIDRTSLEKARSFSATPRQREPGDDTIRAPRPRDDRPYVYKHPLGKIVGAPGRRQRQNSQKLEIDAMKQPFEVIVMQDVREPTEQRPRARNTKDGAIVSAEQLEKQMSNEGEDMTQEEVNESLSALRPGSTVLDQKDYKKLATTLSHCFTAEQLHGYFAQSLNLSAVEGDTVHLLREQPSELQTQYQRTQWRPGRTRLDKRLPLGTIVKKSDKANKPKLIEQILRLSWRLTIHEEEQKFGELEMKLKSTELAYLFDLQYDLSGKAMYEGFVNSRLLLNSCNIQPYRPQKYLRIFGRRIDAEEVARRIETRLSQNGEMVVKLQNLRHLLGTPGWPKDFASLLSRGDLEHIQKRSYSIVEFTRERSGTFRIYGRSDEQRHHARRFLLSMLELPGPASLRLVDDAVKNDSKVVSFPEPRSNSLHYRHRKMSLARHVLPTGRKAEQGDNSNNEAALDAPKTSATSILHQLSKTTAPMMPTIERKEGSYWNPEEIRSSVPWKAQLCRLLRPAQSSIPFTSKRSKKNTFDPTRTPSNFTIPNAQIPRLESLLSFFTPRKEEDAPTAPLLVAKFVPSPLTKSGFEPLVKLPPVELTYDFLRSPTMGQVDDVFLVGARATLEAQDVRVALPGEASDLRFTRERHLNSDGRRLRHDGDVKAFSLAVREGLVSDKKGKGVALTGTPHLAVRLPAEVVGDTSAGHVEKGRSPDVVVGYIFMGFEQRSTSEYVPVAIDSLPARMEPELKDALRLMAEEGLFLQVSEVSAGKVGGSRTEVRVCAGKREGMKGQVSTEQSTQQLSFAAAIGTSETAATARAPNADADGGESATDASSHGASPPPPLPASGSAGSEVNPTKLDAAPEDLAFHTVHAALGLTRLLTKLNAGEMQAMLLHPRPEEHSDEEGEGELSWLEGRRK